MDYESELSDSSMDDFPACKRLLKTNKPTTSAGSAAAVAAGPSGVRKGSTQPARISPTPGQSSVLIRPPPASLPTSILPNSSGTQGMHVGLIRSQQVRI